MSSSKIIYTPIKKAYIIFYSRNKDTKEIKLLFYKEKPNEDFTFLNTEVNCYDTAPTFSVCRKLTVLFNKLFTDDILSKIVKKEDLTPEDLELPYGKYLQYKLWDLPTHQFWLNKIAENDIIQYDDILGETIFFKEIPEIDLTYLNKILDENKYFCNFEFISKDNFNSFKYSSEIKETLEKINIPNLIKHIEDSITFRENNELDTYVVLACKKAGPAQNGFFHFPSLITGIYRRNNEKWIYAVASLDQFPDENTLKHTKCIFIPGSELNVYADVDFLRKAEKYMKKLIEEILFENKYPNLRILGTCFGMQIIVSALGGKVEKSGIVQRFPVEVNLKDSFWDYEFVKASQVKKQNLIICQAHGDAVTKGADEKYSLDLIGGSEKCPFEVLVDKKEKIFLIEGHPEYSPMFLAMKGVGWYLSFEKLEPTDENVNAFLDKSAKDPMNIKNNFNEWRALCFTFMKSS